MNSKKNKEKVRLPGPPVKTGIGASGGTISPHDIPTRLMEDICRWKREVDEHREYFMGKGINPFREAHEILLSFWTIFIK